MRKTLTELGAKTKAISIKFQNNSDFLKNVNTLIQFTGKEPDFETRKQKFLTAYTAYNPQVKKPELIAMTTTWSNLVDECCTYIKSTTTTAAATIKAYILSSGVCPKTKELVKKMGETFTEIYDFQFKLIDAMAAYMKALTAKYAASDMVAVTEELSSQTGTNVIDSLEKLSFMAYISYKTNIWEITGSYCDILTYKESGRQPSVCEGTDSNIARLASHVSPTCRNEFAFRNVPISSTNDQGFMNIRDLHAGKRVAFKIPNADWLITNQWINAEDRDSAIVVKQFEVFLPMQSATPHAVRVDATITGDNRISIASPTIYVIVPEKKFVFSYNEGSGQPPCRQTPITNPYGTTLPKLCPLSVNENNYQELLEKTPLFPSVYSRWKVSISGYDSTRIPIPTNADFRLKVGVKLCILSPRSRYKAAKNKNKNKLEDQERKSCPKDRDLKIHWTATTRTAGSAVEAWVEITVTAREKQTKTREVLVDCYMTDIISDEEFVLLYDASYSKNLELPYDDYGRFDLEEMADSECIAEFRGSVSEGMEGLCMLLRRLSYPCRYSDMIPRFARPTPVLSMVTNKALDFIYDEHSHRIMDWNHDILDPAHLQTYANAVYAKGAALDNCFGFIDGTVRPIARPDVHQRLVYNGHKRVHALKFQSLALPNGIIGNMYGPVGKY
ncbi:hypothetical protein QZH41_001065 [Actinostola sp. cb2023]|nr:hypothetical protein QZH41_001065 [Actinostola sp. cb2023]